MGSVITESSSSHGHKRCLSYAKTETTLLVELVSQNKNVIESKSTDGTTNKLKAETWISIEKKFNSGRGAGTGPFRSAEMLKHKYVDMKRQLRKKIAEYKRQMERYTPGTKKPPTLVLTSEESTIYSWVQSNFDAKYSIEVASANIVVSDAEQRQNNTFEDVSSNYSMTSEVDEDEMDIEHSVKMEPVDEGYVVSLENLNEAETVAFADSIQNQNLLTKKRKLSTQEEENVLEFYRKKELKEDKQHQLLVQKYEMEVSVLQKKLREYEQDKSTNRYEREMLAYYKRREAKEDREHKLRIQKYELEIALLKKQLNN